MPQSFYQRDALDVAQDLIGKYVKNGRIVLRITETEAYRWPDDSANHARVGRTQRNEAMWGPPGFAYIYICYGKHAMLNLVTGKPNEASAVLIRSGEPMSGLRLIEARRGRSVDATIAAGPGKLAQVLGLDRSYNFHCVFKKGRLQICNGPRPDRILRGPRVGIDYARPIHIKAAWRFADANSLAVSHRKTLR